MVFVCENNMYATEMPFQKATKNTNVASRAQAYGMPGRRIDGNDVLAVHRSAGEAIQRAREGGGPTLLECLTYRWFGHHEGDPGVSYRTKEEIATWKERDPVKKLRDDAVNGGLASQQDFDALHAEVNEVLEDAAQFALNSPLEGESTALAHVFAGQGA